MWAVCLARTGQPIGNLLLKPIPRSAGQPRTEPDTEIGWHFHPDFWGNGYGREAAIAVLAYAFDSGLACVVAVASPHNLASQRLCQWIGMTHQGLTDAYYDTTCVLFEATSAPRTAGQDLGR